MDIAQQLEIEALLARYIHCIDDDRLEEWPGFFAEECRYVINSAENHARNLPVGIFMATTRGMLQDRVSALRQANIYEPQRYRHIVSSVLVTGVKDGIVSTQANFHVVRIMLDGTMDLFCTGRYLDRVAGQGDSRKYVEKLVILDNKRIDTLLALPV